MAGRPEPGMVSGMGKHEWSAGETEVLANAVGRAPSVHNIQPWRLEFTDGEVAVHERTDVSLPYHDPEGKDRSISCGAAVANLEIAMWRLSLRPVMRILPDGTDSEVVARLSVEEKREPTEAELRRYSAIRRRRSYRRPFIGSPLPDDEVNRITAAADSATVHARRVRGRGEIDALADLLEYAGVVLKSDEGYQRELSVWTIQDEESRTYGAGVARSASPPTTLPWSGLPRPGTAIPDRQTLVERLGNEVVLVFVTETNDRIAHVRTGIAMQRVWLAAVERGFAAAVQTHPLHLPEARQRFVEKLALSGYPQLLMRVGRPFGTLPQSPRRPVTDVVGPD